MIREVRQFGQHLFYEETHVMRLCSLTGTGTKQLHMFNLYRGLFELLVHNTSVYLAFEAGDTEFFEVVRLDRDAELRDKLADTRCYGLKK